LKKCAPTRFPASLTASSCELPSPFAGRPTGRHRGCKNRGKALALNAARGLNKSDGYVIFPTVGKGAVGIGGSYGRGEVFEHGIFVGYADISQGTIGLQLGGQTFTEVIAFADDPAMKKFESGQFAFDANASAVAMKSGAASTDTYTNGVAVFVDVQGGLMAEAAIGGQSFTYQPK
jgi:lipid-binding SYLF domain-containing protein